MSLFDTAHSRLWHECGRPAVSFNYCFTLIARHMKWMPAVMSSAALIWNANTLQRTPTKDRIVSTRASETVQQL